MAATPRNPKETRLRVGLVQLRCGPEPEDNVARALAAIDDAADRGAQLICLPELFRSRYPCQDQDARRFDLSEPVPGPTTEILGKRAAAREVVLVTTVFERRTEGVYHNTAVTLDSDGELVGLYRKMHVPDDPLYNEKFYFTPGDTGFTPADTHCGRIGTLVCWDQWFPEAARLMALAGARVLLYPTAIGWQFDEAPEVDAAQHDAWETVQRGHAIANGCFVLAINRVGREDGIRFWGQSFVADPFGRVIARGSATNEEIVVVDCDLAEVERIRRDWPFLRDRRIDAYGDLGLRFRD